MAPGIFQSVLEAVHSKPRPGDDKAQVDVTSSEIVLSAKPHHEGRASKKTTASASSPKLEFISTQYRKVRRWGKIVSVVTEVITSIFSTVIEVIMLYVLYKFYTTNQLFIVGRPWGPWAKESIIWPTFMFIATSTITCVLALAALVALCRKPHRNTVRFSLAFVVVHIVVWIVVSVVYRVEKTERDLWGWSCTDKARAIQLELGSGKLDFKGLCSLQVSTTVIFGLQYPGTGGLLTPFHAGIFVGGVDCSDHNENPYQHCVLVFRSRTDRPEDRNHRLCRHERI